MASNTFDINLVVFNNYNVYKRRRVHRAHAWQLQSNPNTAMPVRSI